MIVTGVCDAGSLELMKIALKLGWDLLLRTALHHRLPQIFAQALMPHNEVPYIGA